MAFPTDPPNPAGASASAFAGARITAEEAERLAETFRPSWEIEETPVLLVNPHADSDSRDQSRSGRTAADVRGAVHALNGTHAPAPATVLHEEPAGSVIIDGALPAHAAELKGTETPGMTGPEVAASPKDPLHQRTLMMSAQRTLVMPTAPTVLRPGRNRSSNDLNAVDLGKRAPWGLWLGLGAAALLLLGMGIWFASTSAQETTKDRAIRVPSAEAVEATAETRIRAAPTETAAAPSTTATVAAPSATAAAQSATATVAAPSATATAPAPPVQTAVPFASAAPPPPPPPPQVVAPAPPHTPIAAATPPPAAAPPRPVLVPAPRPPVWTPPPVAAKPPPKPGKPGPTIVRDVPF
jgi:hypothetical protein